MKVYARIREFDNGQVMPYSKNIGLAIDGFHEMGFEVVYYKTGELSRVKEVFTKEDILLDGIDQVNFVLEKFGKSLPEIDYPEPLKKYLGRNVWMDKIDNINKNPSLWGCFVKPLKGKAFTGKVINSPKDLIGCGSCSENYDVYCSDVVDFVFEVRGLVYYNQLVTLQPYKGNWKHMKDLDVDLIENAFKDYISWDKKLNGCTLDFGVTKDGRTLLIEANSGACFGPYMLNSMTYAKIISACFSQILEVEDECFFGELPL